MYFYTMSQGNPEGTDYTFMLQHERDYSQEEFQDICEAAVVETLNTQQSKEEFASVSGVDVRILADIFKKFGFKPIEFHQDYYLEPFWGKQHIRNAELLKWADPKNRQEGEE